MPLPAARAAVYSSRVLPRQHGFPPYFSLILSLAGGAKKGRSAALDDPPNRPCALAAIRPLAVIDIEAMLEIAEIPLDPCKIPQG